MTKKNLKNALHSHLAKAIDELFTANLINRTLMEKWEGSDVEFAKEFATIRFDVGRQTGKNNFIKNHCTENSLIIEYDNLHAKRMKQSIKADRNIDVDVYSSKSVSTPPENLELYFKEKEYDKIYVNEPGLMKEFLLDDVYSFVRNRNQTFFLVGI